jgi:DNA helicase-4
LELFQQLGPANTGFPPLQVPKHRKLRLEADIVFVLRACERAFRLIHPDFMLFRLFGDSEQQILEDERRLFDVALTRAKDRVWFLTATDRESDFVKEFMETEMPIQSIHLTESSRQVPGM